MDELRECPFCGGHARMGLMCGSVGVTCQLCGASLVNETKETAIAAWNARAPVVPEWRDIETDPPPRDGMRIILCWKAIDGVDAHSELGKWKSGEGWCNTYGKPFLGEPDYWIPLPAAPKVTP